MTIGSLKCSFFGLALVAFLFGASHQTAWAQRGQLNSTYSSSPKTPSSGFQGFFDTEQLDAGTFTGDVPSFSVDYGISERLSIGTNSLLVLGLPFGLQTLLVKSRYRFYSDGKIVSALTVYGGGLILGSVGYGYLGMVTSNTSLFLDSKQSVGLSFIGARLGAASGSLGDLSYARLGVSAGFIAGEYRFALSKNLLFEFLLGTFIAQSIEADTAGQSLNIDAGLGALSAGSFVGRGMVDVRLFDGFLFSPQLYVLGSLGGQPSLTPIPMVNAAFRIKI